MNTKKALSLGCLSFILIFALLIGLAWITGNVRPMTDAEKQALEDRIKSNQPPPYSPPPKTWPIGLPKGGPELPDPWSYAVEKLISDPENWPFESAKYRLDDPAAARHALEEQLKFLSLDEMPKWKDTVDDLVRQATLDYRRTIRDSAHCEKVTAMLAEHFLPPTVLTKGNANYQAVLADYGMFPGKVSYQDGRNPGWRVDAGEHQDPNPAHWNAWKSQEVAAALLQWIAAYPDAQFYVLRFTDRRFGRQRHGYYTWRRLKERPSVLTCMQPDDLGELGDIFDPNNSQVDPHFVSARIHPSTAEVSESDLASAAAGKLDLNELLLDVNPFKPFPSRPALTDDERRAIVNDVLGKAAKAFKKP